MRALGTALGIAWLRPTLPPKGPTPDLPELPIPWARFHMGFRVCVQAGRRALAAELHRAVLDKCQREGRRVGGAGRRERQRAPPAAARHARQLAAVRCAREHVLVALRREQG